MKKRMFIVSIFLIFLFNACNRDGSSDGSNSLYLPAMPTDLVVTELDGNEVTIEWVDNADNESGFIVERSINRGEYELVFTAESDVTEFTENLPDDTIYTYRIYAFNSVGDSDISNETSIKRPVSAQVEITTDSGGIIELTNLANITFPSDSFSSNESIIAIEGVKGDSIAEGKEPYIDVVSDIKAVNIIDFTAKDLVLKKNIKLVMNYKPDLLVIINEDIQKKSAELINEGVLTQENVDKMKLSTSELSIYYFNTISNKWVKTNAVINTTNHTFTIDTSYLGIYCVGYSQSEKIGFSFDAYPDVTQHLIDTISTSNQKGYQGNSIESKSIGTCSKSCKSLSKSISAKPYDGYHSSCNRCPSPLVIDGVPYTTIPGTDKGTKCDNCSSVGANLDAASGYAFTKGCANHDCCYRYGFTTYGFIKEICDVNLYGEMIAGCYEKYPFFIKKSKKIFGFSFSYWIYAFWNIPRHFYCTCLSVLTYAGVATPVTYFAIVPYDKQPCVNWYGWGIDCFRTHLRAIKTVSASCEPGETINSTSNVYNPGDRSLTYIWSATSGTINNASSANITWTAPAAISDDTEVTLTLTISDGTNTIPSKTRTIPIRKPYTITYNSNGASSGTPPDVAGHIYNGSANYASGNTGTLAKIGYNFGGWNTEANGTGFDHPEGSFFIMGKSNAVLYAKWTTNPVTYNGNGNTGGSAPVDVTVYTIGSEVTVPGNTNGLVLSNNPYVVFVGWNTAQDGSGIDYIEGDTFILNTTNITLYAKYVVNADYHDLVYVPGGTFNQKRLTNRYDSPDCNYNFEHTLSPFKIAKYEVTYELWYTVYQWANNHGYYFANAGREGSAGLIGGTPTALKYEPVTTINWRDMIVWCNAYSELMGFTPVYYRDISFTVVLKDSRDGSYGSNINNIPGGFDYPYVNWTAKGYRLPTEGEWQYAASWKGSNNTNGAIEFPLGSGSYWTPFNYGSGSLGAITGLMTEDYPLLHPIAWFGGGSGNATKTQNVGGKIPNVLGIYDMSGNAREWCWDEWTNWPEGASTDYRGSFLGTPSRVFRGGSYSDENGNLRVGKSLGSDVYHEFNFLGFRVAKCE